MHDTARFSALLIPKRDAFDAIGVGNTRGHELLAQGKLDARKLGSRTMITAASLHAFVAELPPFVSKAAAQ